VGFQNKVREEVLRMLEQGIPERPARFIKALQSFYNTPPLTPADFPALQPIE